MAKNEILSEIKKAEENAKKMIDEAIEVKTNVSLMLELKRGKS